MRAEARGTYIVPSDSWRCSSKRLTDGGSSATQASADAAVAHSTVWTAVDEDADAVADSEDMAIGENTRHQINAKLRAERHTSIQGFGDKLRHVNTLATY